MEDRKIDKKDMMSCFDDMNLRLSNIGKYAEIIIAGGAALTLVHGARDSTRDIDAIFEPKAELRPIIEEIAAEKGLPKDWLNDGVKGFITKEMKYSELLCYSNLKISTIDTEPLLAMKLTSARQVSQDMNDSLFLMKQLDIQSEAQLYDIVQKYVHPNRQTVASHYFIKEAFDQYSQQRENIKAKQSVLEELQIQKEKIGTQKITQATVDTPHA